MFDSAKGKGFLYYKLKNKRSGGIVISAKVPNAVEPEYTDKEIDDLKLYFKTCLVSEQGSDLLDKLKSTVAIRMSLLNDKDTNFPETFPFYFVSPDIVSTIYVHYVSIHIHI